jgi:hypothetical protein
VVRRVLEGYLRRGDAYAQRCEREQ